MDIDTGIIVLGMDVTDWLLNIVVAVFSIVMGIRVGRLRERHAKKQIELTEFEKVIKEQEAKVDAIDRDINRRVADLDSLDLRRTTQQDRIINLENEILDCRNDQSKAGTRMNKTALKLKETETGLEALDNERAKVSDKLDDTRESRRLGRRDLGNLINPKK